jgi:hypothetical protein
MLLFFFFDDALANDASIAHARILWRSFTVMKIQIFGMCRPALGFASLMISNVLSGNFPGPSSTDCRV